MALVGKSTEEPGVAAWEATNLVTVAGALVASARLRAESRGCHWRSDVESRRPEWHGHLVATAGARWPGAPVRPLRQPGAGGSVSTAAETDPVRVITDLEQATALVADVGLDLAAVRAIVLDALAEDLGGRGVLPPGAGAGLDVTSVATVAADVVATGELVARRPGVVAGLGVAALVLAEVCAPAGPFRIELRSADADRVVRGDVLATVSGNARALLRAERVALNLLTAMSGVATATAAWVAALDGSGARVRDSRKTVPGLRMLQKYAVRVGGGVNHRMCLADAALIKDNHVIAAGGVVPAYRAVREAFPELGVQVEVTTAEQARDVIAAGARDILLDNMPAPEMAAVVAASPAEVVFEASGGLTVADAARVAATGVDFVAVGAITHSAPILDVALDLVT